MPEKAKSFLLALVVGTGIWGLAIAGWFLGVVYTSPNLLNALLMCGIVLIGAIWLEWFLHSHKLRFEAEQGRAKDTRGYRVHMTLWILLLAVLVAILLTVAIWFPEKLFAPIAE